MLFAIAGVACLAWRFLSLLALLVLLVVVCHCWRCLSCSALFTIAGVAHHAWRLFFGMSSSCLSAFFFKRAFRSLACPVGGLVGEWLVGGFGWVGGSTCVDD